MVLLSLFGCLPVAMLKGPGFFFFYSDLGVMMVFFLRDRVSKPAAIEFFQLVDVQGASIAGAGLPTFGLTQK